MPDTFTTFFDFNSEQEIWILTRHEDTIEFLTRDKPDGNPRGRIPIFHVWQNQKWLYCGLSQEKADSIFKQAAYKGIEAHG